MCQSGSGRPIPYGSRVYPFAHPQNAVSFAKLWVGTMRRSLRIAKYVAVAALWSATGASGSSDYRAEQPPIGGPAGAASVCVSWYGTSAAVAVCQPVLLRAAIRDGTISLRIKPNVRIPGFHGRIVAAKGITQ